jgi:hypothetical protein
MKKAESIHLDNVAELGCIVCYNKGHPDTPACIHHIRAGQGMSQRASSYETIPLCPTHHQHGGFGVAIHAGQRTWEKKYGTELELLEQVRGML